MIRAMTGEGVALLLPGRGTVDKLVLRCNRVMIRPLSQGLYAVIALPFCRNRRAITVLWLGGCRVRMMLPFCCRLLIMPRCMVVSRFSVF